MTQTTCFVDLPVCWTLQSIKGLCCASGRQSPDPQIAQEISICYSLHGLSEQHAADYMKHHAATALLQARSRARAMCCTCLIHHIVQRGLVYAIRIHLPVQHLGHHLGLRHHHHLQHAWTVW